jgi:hypothetical protein
MFASDGIGNTRNSGIFPSGSESCCLFDIVFFPGDCVRQMLNEGRWATIVKIEA